MCHYETHGGPSWMCVCVCVQEEEEEEPGLLRRDNRLLPRLCYLPFPAVRAADLLRTAPGFHLILMKLQ